MFLSKLIFAWKIKSVFDKLLTEKNKVWHSKKLSIQSFKAADFFMIYKAGKEFWEVGEIVNRIGSIMYMVHGGNCRHKWYLDQLKPRSLA